MPKDIIIIIIIIINIIIIIKAPTATQGLEAKAEERQAGIAAEGTASPTSGSHHRAIAGPSLPRWNHSSQSWGPCAVPQATRGTPLWPQSTAPTGRDDPALPAEGIPLIPRSHTDLGTAALGQAEHPGIPRDPARLYQHVDPSASMESALAPQQCPKGNRCPAEL